MGRLIDTDGYEKRIKPYDTEDVMDKALYNFAHEKLVTTPSAQTEIIRCRDCKHYQFADNRAFGMPVKLCEWFEFEDVDDDDFCSRAERREDG